ncbi:hypothetical protein NW768_001450 [Fusarium equiseti]|uniref:Cbr-clec-223 protein n=1 Tax=Fusarium equiseti TaxID=61235 RepID=A0ABQ8RQH4_FUSEQ|nr:hypothetical protein NW768_001450 [Fusarium equiseti]
MDQAHPASAGGLPPTGPPPPPKPVLDPSRVYGKQQAPNLREAFDECYPNGLPVFYKMLQTPNAQGVPQTYLEDYLPVGFYTNPRIEAGAIFSTRNRTQPFRTMDHVMPQRRIHLWSGDEIQSVCNSLRRLYWHSMKHMQKPTCWDDLWSYFDTFDIYHYGAMNLWNVLSHLYDENQIIAFDVNKRVAYEVGLWLDEWLWKEQNGQKLEQWDTAQSMISIFTKEDWNEIGNCDPGQLALLENALKHRYSLMMSPEKLRLGANAKPKHLMKSYAGDDPENWLAGHRIFEPSGLPPQPAAEPHRCSPTSRKASAPVLVQNGKHFYQPPPVQRPPSAVEALQQSAAAGPAADSNSERVSTKQTEEGDPVARGTLHVSPKVRSKSTEPFPSYVVPSPQNNGKIGQATDSSMDGKKMPIQKDSRSEKPDAQTPTKSKRRGRGNPRATRGAGRSSVTASLPSSPVMEFSNLATPEGLTIDDKQRTGLSPSHDNPAAEDTSSFGKREDTESRPDVSKDSEKQKRPSQSLAHSSTQEHNDSQFLGDMGSFNHLRRPAQNPQTGLVPGAFAEGTIQLNNTHNPLGITFQPPGTFNPGTQGGYSIPEQTIGASSGFGYRHISMQQPPVLQKGLAPYRSRNATNSSRLERFELNDNRWTHHPENFTNTSSVLNRGAYQRGGRKSAGRRGGYNQRNATAPVTQLHYGSDFAQKQRDGGSWRNKGRREGSDPVQVVCQNVQDDFTIKDYVHCSCQMCEARNRSMHVVAEAQQDIPVAEMQSRIKSGLSEIYGFVDGVFPLPSKEPGRFVVRFRRPSSVGAALTIGGGNMPEQGLSLVFSPAMRSKWTLSEKAPTRVASGQSTGQHPSSLPFSPYPFGLVMPGNAQSATTTHHTPPGMLHPSVANPANAQIWDKGGVQHEFATVSQPSIVNRSSVPHQSTANMTHFVPRVHCLPQNQHIVANDTYHYNVSTTPIEPLQTKPPAEEALGDNDDQNPRDEDSPRSDGSKAAGAKARVSLPNTPSKASIDPEEPPGAHPETIEKSTENQTGAEIESRPQPSEPAPAMATHTRAPSVFTENEIKERRQAWAKIPMPLNPQRPKDLKLRNTNRGTVKNDDNSGASEDDRREAYATGSEMSTPIQTVAFTPETGSIYEQSSDQPASPRPVQKDPALTRSIGSVGLETATLKNDDRDEPLSAQTDTAYSPIGGAAQRHLPNQMKLSMPVEKDAPMSDVHATNQQPEYAQETQTKGKGKGSKSKSKSKKKKSSKQRMIAQGNESSSRIPQNDSFSPAQSTHIAPETYQNASISAHLGSLFRPVSENESFDVSPTKRPHEEPEQQYSTSGSFKRIKKQGDDPEASLQSQLPPLDEFDSPDEDARGRKGFRVGKGGSLRMGKTRRHRPVTIGSALTEQSKSVAMSPPSSNFAFQCQNASAYAGSSSLHDPDNSATSRLNPKAQEFVSPSRVTLFNAQVPVVFSEDEDFKKPALDDATNRIRKAGQIDQEPLKLEIGSVDASPIDVSTPSTIAPSTLKHRRALSEEAGKENHTSDKEAVCHTQAKTPGKGPKRAKGKERATALSAKTERNEGEKETTQNSPRTPKQHDKTKKPGMINDDWPSLPVSRDRALSKPQTPPVWGTKTKTAEENGESPPITK